MKMEKEGLIIKQKIDAHGKVVDYKVRKDRNDIFYPYQWQRFEDTFKKDRSKYAIFDSMINLGGRIDEHLHIRPKDLIDHGFQVHLWKTKTKAKKGETEGKPRSPGVPPSHFSRMRKYAKGLRPHDYIFHNPKDPMKPMTSMAVYSLFKAHLKLADLDPDKFSLHNIRKTHGRWLSAIGYDPAKICIRLGHDMNTYIKHYSNPIPFTDADVMEIRRRFKDIIIN